MKNRFIFQINELFNLIWFIGSSLNFSNTFTFMNLYCSIVRNGLEYVSRVCCHPIAKFISKSLSGCNVNSLDTSLRPSKSISRWRICLMNTCIYFPLHLLPLSLRREQINFLFLHNLINGGINSSHLLELVTFSVNTRRIQNRALFLTHQKIKLKIIFSKNLLLFEENDCFTMKLLNYSVCWHIVFMWWIFLCDVTPNLCIFFVLWICIYFL